MALLHADLDHFKRVNDAYGHPTGDEVLVQVGSVLRDLARRSDAVGRVGGEEFSVLLPGSDLVEAASSPSACVHGSASCRCPSPSPSASACPPCPDPARDQDELISLRRPGAVRGQAAGRDRVVVAAAPRDALASHALAWS